PNGRQGIAHLMNHEGAKPFQERQAPAVIRLLESFPPTGNVDEGVHPAGPFPSPAWERCVLHKKEAALTAGPGQAHQLSLVRSRLTLTRLHRNETQLLPPAAHKLFPEKAKLPLRGRVAIQHAAVSVDGDQRPRRAWPEQHLLRQVPPPRAPHPRQGRGTLNQV